MRDDLERLKAALDAATPALDRRKRAADLALARKNFRERQETPPEPRPTSDRPTSGLLRGVGMILATMTTRGGLAATTALVALAMVAFTPLGETLLPRDLGAPSDAPRARQESIEADDAGADALAVEAPAIVAEPAPMPSPMPAPMAGRSVGALAKQAARPMPLPDAMPIPGADTEAFANADDSPLKIVADDPVSTFSIDVDTFSYAVVRNSLNAGQLPPRDAVRIEEMINYFPYDYPLPDPGAAFRPTVSVSQTPWNADTRLVQIGIQGATPPVEDRPPLNLVFLIDTSGSMKQPDKLPLLKQAFSMLLGQLGSRDQVAIVAYAGSAGQVLAPTPATDKAAIHAALSRLEAGGSTGGQEGLQQAYAVAAAMAEEGEVNRIVLATDGDFNVGLSDPEMLKQYIAAKRDQGTYLSVLGFGRGNLDDATMQALAQNGNGTAAYIDTLAEAQKVLVDQVAGALFPIADDVKVQVEFNPAEVAEYRLIGYETRALRREDFNNDAVDAGEIGAGHQVTALYEVTPVGSPARLTDDLRYQSGATSSPTGEGELGFLRLRHKAPGAADSELIEMPITASAPPAPDAGFAQAIAGFGQLLRGSDYLGGWSWDDAITLANASRGDDPFGYRGEAVQLMRLAKSLTEAK